MSLAPRVVVVHRRTEYDELLARHGTKGHAAFFLSTRGRGIDDVEHRHTLQQQALTTVTAAIPLEWRRGILERGDLDRFPFADGDIIVAVGQDGLVANVAKYLDGQPVIGINPDPSRNPGVLVAHPPERTAELLRRAASTRLDAYVETRTMVQADADDGQKIVALNEIYLGHPSHQSSRYTLHTADGQSERQCSSGLLVGTGTGATGWCRSAWLQRHSGLTLPQPTEPALCWFVREAWPSAVTGTACTEGLVTERAELAVTIESDQLVAFGDGIESDALTLNWGQRITFHTSTKRLRLLHAN